MYGKYTSPMDPSWVYICMKFDPPKNESHLHSPKLTSRPREKGKGPQKETNIPTIHFRCKHFVTRTQMLNIYLHSL